MAKPVREEFQFGQRVLESEAWSVTWWCTESEAWSVTWWCTETIVHTWASCTATDLYEGGFASGHLYHSAAKGPDVSLKHTTTVSCTLAPNTATMQQSLLRMSHRHRKVIFCLKINSSYSFWSRRVNILTCNLLSFPPHKNNNNNNSPTQKQQTHHNVSCLWCADPVQRLPKGSVIYLQLFHQHSWIVRHAVSPLNDD